MISGLQSMAVREDAIRLGGSDPSFSSEYEGFLTNKVLPAIQSASTESSHHAAELVQRLIKCLELIRPSMSVGNQARLAAIESLGNMNSVVSFEPGPASLGRHISVCNVLWTAIESDCDEVALAASKTFTSLYRNGHVVMDAELSTRLHRFVQWLRGLFTSASRIELLKEAPGIIHLLVQVFSGAAESYLTPLLGDLVILLQQADQPGAERLHEVQVKTLTFIAYIGRSTRSESLRALDSQIAKSCIKLLRAVPTSANINTRRELLLNLRSCFHCADLCVAFVPLIDDLFDETVVVGVGRSAYDLLRPIVLSALADFTNMIKDKIPMERLRKILGFFCAAMADSDLPISSQFTSARIILNLIDQVFNKSSSRSRKIAPGPSGSVQDGSDILREILRSIAEKFTSLVLFVPKVIALLQQGLLIDLPTTAPKVVFDHTEVMSRLVGRGASPSGVPLADLLVEGVREVRSLIRTLLLSAKMIVHCLTHRVTARLLTKADMGVVESLLEDGLKVSHLFACAAGYVQSAGFDMSTGHSSANGGGRFGTPMELAIACSIQEERDLIEQLGGVLTVIPPSSLVDLLSRKILWLIDSIQANSQLMVLCNSLIQSPSSMAVLCEVIYGLLAVKGEEILIGPLEKNRTKHQSRNGILDPGIDRNQPKIVSATPGLPVRLGIGLEPPASVYHSLLGPPSACAYFISDHEAIDGALLVTHVMPSLDLKLREYKDIVSGYQLRDSSGGLKIDGRDVLLTISKTLSRQVISGGNPVVLEAIVRPFVSDITVTCIRIAKAYPASAAYCAGTLRYMYRLMGSGTKTTSTLRDLSDLVSVVVDQCRGLGRTHKYNSALSALWLEVALTIPVRLKSLVPCFETMMAVLIETLAIDSTIGGETIAVGLSVLESWVDGLTPDFLFPLIPGHSDRSLINLLQIHLTAPPRGATVHTSVSGNNAVRAARILGKLGVKSKFVAGSYNVTGETEKREIKNLHTKYLVEVAGRIVEIDVESALHASIGLFEKHCKSSLIELPVSLQDPPADANEVTVYPIQELLDALNIVVTCLASHRSQEVPEDRILTLLYRALIKATNCVVALVADRARDIVSSLIEEEVEEIAIAAICENSTEILTMYVNSIPMASTRHQSCPEQLVRVVERLADRLLSFDGRSVIGAAQGLLAIANSSKAHIAFTENGTVVVDRILKLTPSSQTCADVVIALNAVVKQICTQQIADSEDTLSQDQQVQWLTSRSKLLGPIKAIVELSLSHLSVGPFGEAVLSLISSWSKVSVSALVCWADPDLDIVRCVIEGGGVGSFSATSFLLQLRPVPELTQAGDKLHRALLGAIEKAAEWMEKEDELRALYDPAAQGGAQQQAYFLQRGVMKRHLVGGFNSVPPPVEALRVLKLTLLHPQLGQSSIQEDRIEAIVGKCLFSFDYETAAAAVHVVNACRLNFSNDSKAWSQVLFPLCRDIAMRLPTSVVEVQGIGRLLQLAPLAPEEAKAELADRLFERLHSYLAAMRERTYTPSQSGSSWRSDPLVAFAAATLECVGGLQTERFPLVERLLQLASQLDAALPSAFGAGQISSPFLYPLIPSLCIDPERTADQLLTKMELHKVFGLVAELVSLKACLGLRKSLQDKCHQMSLMDTGVLMMRTAAASLISVLARHDPGYLWIQYCSVIMKASMGLPRSLSLIESLVRNWEASLASLTSASHRGPGGPVALALSLSPGGIVGPSDTSSSVNSYEGRFVAWSVMQFLRAPIMTSPGLVTDMESHLNIRVRLLIRLATSLSLKSWIEVSPIQDWFVSEAVSLTSPNEKREIVTKIVEAFSDGGVGVGCRYVLLRYLLIPQLSGLSSIDEALIERIVTGLFNPAMHLGEMDEAVRVELLRVLGLLLKSHRVKDSAEMINEFVRSCVHMNGVAVKQQAAFVATQGLGDLKNSSSLISDIVMSMFDASQGEYWKKCIESASEYIVKRLPSLCRSETPELVEKIKAKLVHASGSDVYVWKWFLLIQNGLDGKEFISSIEHLFARKQILATTDARVTALEVALVAVKWSGGSSVLANFFLRHGVNGPEPHGPGTAAVSPTLWSEYMEKCLLGLGECGKRHRLTEVGSVIGGIRIPQADIVRHCKQLVALGRMLNVVSDGISESGHVAHYIGLAMVSTDKSVAAVLGFFIAGLMAKIDAFPGSIEDLLHVNDSGPQLILKQIAAGIQAGLGLACNSTTAAKVRIHPTNPHSPSYLVTPYTAVACLIGVLRGLGSRKDIASIKKWLQWAQPLLVKATTQSSRSLVLGLLPQHLHPFALTGTQTSAPALDVGDVRSGAATTGAASFAYQGVLQGPEFAVPSLLEIVRLAHIATDLVGIGDKKSFKDSIMWLVECLGPFVSLASPNHQTFSNVLVALNFTAPSSFPEKKVHGAGGLSGVISVVQLSALLRHCVGIVGRWSLGPHYSVKDNDDAEWILDHCCSGVSPDNIEKQEGLVLSLSTSLIGSDALLACCDVTPVVQLLLQNIKSKSSSLSSVDESNFENLSLTHRSMDGISILASLSNDPVKKMLGFVPSRSVACFPGSAVDGRFSLKSGPGGLFALTSELVLQVLSAIPSKQHLMVSSILLGCCSSDRLVRNSFVSYLRQVVPESNNVSDRLEWLLKTCPWHVVVGRMFLPVMVEVILSGVDDRVSSQEAAMTAAEFPFMESVLSLSRSLTDGKISLSLFVQVFSQLVTPESFHLVVAFLSKPCLDKQSWFKPNVPEAILKSARCSFPPHLLVHCATHFGLPYEALNILELMDPSNNPETAGAIETIILRSLGDRDGWLASLLQVAKDSDDLEMMEAIALMSQGRNREGRDMLTSKSSESIRSDMWIEACKSLSDWGSLVDVEDPSTKIESFAKGHDWGQVGELMAVHDWSTNPRAKLIAGYLGLSFSDIGDAGKQRAFLTDMESSINRALHQLVAVQALDHPDNLLLCQELVELGEAAALITDVRSAVMGHRSNYPNPKQILNAWRDRVPEKSDGSDVWFDLLTFRLAVFKQIQQLCSVDVVAQTHISPFLHDLPWTLVKLASNMSSGDDSIQSQHILNRFQQSLSRSTDAYNQEVFEALKEQIKLYAPKSVDDENQVRIGLNVLNCCAISHSNSQQAAEMSWLQGRLMKRLRGMEGEAKTALLLAVNTYPMIAKAWVDLGDVLYDEDDEDLEECMMAYMMGLALRPSRAAKLVPRLLLLAKRGCTSLAAKCKDSQPSAVWIGWVPLLIRSLADEGGMKDTAIALLSKISLSFPQSVYWFLQMAGTNDVVCEMVNDVKLKPLIDEVEKLRNFLLTIGERSSILTDAEACLDDLRYKRATVAEVRQRLGKGVDASEAGLTKLIKSERCRLSAMADSTVQMKVNGIEIPGNYTRYLSVPSGSSMESISFVRIAHVEAGIGSKVVFVGSNGLRYTYVIEKRPSFDGIGMQTSALVNELLQKTSETKRRNLKINCLQSIPLGNGMVLREAPEQVVSFDQIVGDVEESVLQFKNRVDSISARNAERVAFDSTEFSDEFLIQFIDAQGPKELYNVARQFTNSIGTVGMVDHVVGFSATDRPISETFLSGNGSLFVVDASACRPAKHSHIDTHFRLTRNPIALMGDRNLVGVLPAVMRAVVDCLDTKRSGLFDFLEFIDADVGKCQERIEDITEADGYLFYKIEKLINESRDPKNLAAVQPKQWLPWM